MRLVACALVVAFSAGACSSGDGDRSAAPTSPSTAAVPADVTCTAFHGTEGPLQSFGERPQSLLVAADVDEVGCLDRVTFEFESLGGGLPPGYTVTYQDLERDPLINAAGGQIELPTSTALMVVITPARSVDTRLPDAPPTYRGPTRLSYGETHHIEIVTQLDDTDDSVRWVIGVDEPRPFVVDSATNPARVSVYIG